MAKDLESTAKWKLDITQLKAGMQEAKRSISQANAEFKNATAGMGKWSDSITGVESKLGQLNKVSDGQRKILDNLNKAYEQTVAELGEASPEAEKLKTQILNQEAAVKRTEAQIGQYNDRLNELQQEQQRANSPMGQLNSTISEQENELDDLKQAYANAVLEFGKGSSEAKSLEGSIESLSGELAENKGKLDAAEKAADELDQSLENAGESAEGAANGGFSALQVALGNLIADGIQQAIQFVGDLVDDAIAASDSLQKFEGTMGFAGYDGAAIQQARQDVQDYADATVYDLETIANTTAQLAANGIEDYTGLTQAAGNLNAVAGGNAETFNSLAMMLTQTAGAGKLTTENWNQLADAIPGASGVLQDALRENGAYTGDFREAMAAGEITADEFNEALMQLGSDPVAVEAATSVSTFEGAMGNLEATVVNGLMNIYEQIGSENITGFITSISDAIEGMIPYIQDAVQWVLDNKDAIIAALAGIAAGIAAMTVVNAVMGMVEAFKAWKLATEGMTIAQRALNLVMAANPIGIIITLIAAVVAALVTLYMTNEDFRNKVLEIWGNIKEFIGGAIEGIKTFFTETLPNAIQTMLDWFGQIPDKVLGFITNTLTAISDWVISVENKALEAGKTFLGNIVNFFTQLPIKVGNFLTTTINRVKTWVANMISNALSAGKSFLSNVVSFISQLPNRIGSYLSNVISKVASWASNMASKAKEGASKLVSNVVNTVKSLPSKMLSVGEDVVKGIWNGISGSLSWIKGKITGWVGNVTSFLKNLFGIGSPSRLMRDEIGQWLPKGIFAGWDAGLPDMVRGMRTGLDDAIDSLKGDVRVSASGITGAFGNGGGTGANGAPVGGAVYNFNQTINSQQPLSTLEIYRNTNSLLFKAKAGANV